MDPDADDDEMEPEEVMEACEKRVAKLMARGDSAAAAWDEVSRSPFLNAPSAL
jgi:hypothetical protein